MARTNIEDDLWTSGRLAKLARSAKLDEDTALGRLVNVYRLTQRAGIISDTPARIVTVVVLAFADDEQADRFLTAMMAAQLATMLENGQVHIRGNEKHVERLTNLKQSSSAGGKMSQEKKRNDSKSASLELARTDRARVEHSQTLPSPFSLLPASASSEAERERSRARAIEARGRPKDPPVADPDSLSTYTVEAIPMVDAKHVYDAWADELLTKRGLKMPPIESPRDLRAFKVVLLWSGDRDVATKIARAWVNCEDAKGYFKRMGWAPWLLAEEPNYAEARTLAAKILATQRTG